MDIRLPTVVVVDDAAEVRSLVRTRLRVSRQFAVVGEGSTGLEAVELAEAHRPALLLLDVSMPRMDGLEALPRILAVSPDTRVVLYSGFDEQGLADRARQLGAAGFLEKSASVSGLADDLAAFLRAPRDGGRAVGPPAPPAPDGDGDGETDLTRHLERFRELFEQAAIGMATMTLTGQIVRANRALAALLERDVADLLGVPYADLASAGRAAVIAAIADVGERRSDVDTQGPDMVQVEHDVDVQSGHRRLRATVAPVRDVDGRPLYLSLQAEDVTAQRRAEEQLRQSEERFRLLVEAVRDYAIFMLDPAGRVASWNTGAQRIKGYTATEIVGQHFRIFYPPDKQADRHPEHELELAVRDGVYEEEGWRVRKDGSRIWANVVITAVRNPAGTLVGFAKVTRDVTERRQLLQDREDAAAALSAANQELEAANARLARAAADQSQFLAVTAHELRGPVGVLSGSSDVLSSHLADLTDEERTELLASMSGSAQRLRRLLGDLLTASRLEARALDLQPRVIRLADALAAAAASVHTTRPDVEVLIEPVPGDVAVVADPDRLAQAVDNLLGNALLHGAAPIRVSAVAHVGTVEIRVSDAGAGVPEGLRDRLFQRFATGQRRGGTGLGLFIVRELARAQGGDAWYEPGSPPAGSFVLSLPAARTAAPP